MQHGTTEKEPQLFSCDLTKDIIWYGFGTLVLDSFMTTCLMDQVGTRILETNPISGRGYSFDNATQ